MGPDESPASNGSSCTSGSENMPPTAGGGVGVGVATVTPDCCVNYAARRLGIAELRVDGVRLDSRPEQNREKDDESELEHGCQIEPRS